jgi:peptide/nickel transport system permease protein
LGLGDHEQYVTRSATMQVRALDYIAAARAHRRVDGADHCGRNSPNIANALVVVATLEMAQAILLEATLSFLGLGVPPPAPSWGLMVAEGKEYMFFSPWVIHHPGGWHCSRSCLAINLLGDGLRDLGEPRFLVRLFH